MSLLLVQGYESPEEEEPQDYFSDSDEEYAGDGVKEKVAPVVKPSNLQQAKPPPRTSDLPTAFEMFTEVTGPPDFLKHSVTARVNGDLTSMTPTDFSRGYVAPKEPKPRHTPTAAAVVQAKPQVSNVEQDAANAAIAAKKRAPGAGLPPAEDAANLLRMCANCGVPKTYSGAKEGMVCPVCGDRPVVAGAEEKSKRGNKVKDKEHSKRMKGQSAHSTWKSESEMHLRQQFD